MPFQIEIDGKNIADKHNRKKAIETILSKTDTEGLQMFANFLENPKALGAFKENYSFLKSFVS
ncbi:hypothetical protein BTO06_04045 [Tenacibaculum sp. SZ-18]|uniref:hypothetical protein n=1 Tax=Tenacibaculum sp. SZ-18 TaxID=754423 RepID=UPI000C2CFE59|nr:hypothetical protein [Tenacibaculum sp. SZ-18]AUC13685.1 hypothetical protein BTO06_00340 [Tenacibaculum sp. SZ-18]AUC14364.1 hypothetical protein BTO06_04045 [Tenacibaculum sp. SZ-18]